MKAIKIFSILTILALAISGCKVSNLTSSKLVNRTVDKVATKAIYGNYNWASDNLDVATFRNGDPIPEAKTDEEWVQAAKEGKPAWCYLNNDPANGKKYGKLYNWYAVSDPRGLAPQGYRLPTYDDYQNLIKSTGSSAANNRAKQLMKGGKTGYNSKMGGYRTEEGYFKKAGDFGRYWSESKYNETRAHTLYIERTSNTGSVTNLVFANGFSVRCIKE
ncbi:MAG: fibrobacter succinogenes major paralogous domain-containing protein [Bacteroidales bacterium]|nr:fibrobacter succinogenes major paralogous domain-containing protein [Bacteroidales bacterium]MBN2748883.1 fibrobacter succinogenes major paralogous domain-containing protein [Bacteroidales bacterium]